MCPHVIPFVRCLHVNVPQNWSFDLIELQPILTCLRFLERLQLHDRQTFGWTDSEKLVFEGFSTPLDFPSVRSVRLRDCEFSDYRSFRKFLAWFSSMNSLELVYLTLRTTDENLSHDQDLCLTPWPSHIRRLAVHNMRMELTVRLFGSLATVASIDSIDLRLYPDTVERELTSMTQFLKSFGKSIRELNIDFTNSQDLHSASDFCPR